MKTDEPAAARDQTVCGDAPGRLLARRRPEQLAAVLVLGLVALYVAVATTATEGYVVFRSALSPDGRFFVHSSSRGSVLFDVQSGKQICTLRPAGYEFSPSARRFAACRGGRVQIWDLTGPTYLFALDVGDERVWRVAFLDDETLAVVKPRAVEQWSLRERERKSATTIDPGIPEGCRPTVAVSLDGRRVVIADDWLGDSPSGGGEWHYRLDVWDLGDTPRQRELARDRRGTIGDVVLSNDGRLLAAEVRRDRSFESALQLWDLDSEAPPESQAVGAVHAAAFSPGSTRLAFVNWRYPASTIGVWEIGSGRITRVARKERPSDGRIDALAFQPDGTGIVTGDSNGVVESSNIDPPALVARVTGLHLPPPVRGWVWGALAAFFCIWTAAWIKQQAGHAERSASDQQQKSRAAFLGTAIWALFNAGVALTDAYAETYGAFPNRGRTLGIMVLISLCALGTLTVTRFKTTAANAILNIALLIAVGVVCFDLGLLLRFAQDSA